MATTPLAPAAASVTPRPQPQALPEAGVERDLRVLVRQAFEDPERRFALIGALVGFGLLCLTFWVNLQHLVYAWSTDENYSHGFLVPLISLYFANQAAKRGPVAVRGGMVVGIGLLGVSILLRLAMILVPVPFVGDFAFLLGLTGICALVAGSDALKRYGFALFFLVFMVPLPIALYSKLAAPLQLLASQIASVVLNASGVPVLCQGNMMTLPGNVQMFVAEACSGMRQMTGFLALTAAVAYLSRQPLWYRAGVILSAVPIALTANVARVTLTGYIMYFVNPAYASGAYHTLEGLLMMGFGLALLRGGCWVLDQVALVFAGPPAPAPAPATPA